MTEGDFVVTTDAPMYYVSIDPSGRLAWQKNYVDYGGVDSPVIEVITERVSNAYKDFLRRMKISYVIAGKERIDNGLALHKLADVFGMKRVMIGGGGVLNWSFLHDDLVDEVSIVFSSNATYHGIRKALAQDPRSVKTRLLAPPAERRAERLLQPERCCRI